MGCEKLRSVNKIDDGRTDQGDLNLRMKTAWNWHGGHEHGKCW